MTERRYDIDWLRVIAVLAVFLLHTSQYFDTEGWILKNAERSFIVNVLRGALLDMWVMPLLFLLSGAASWYALKSRNAGQYLLDRGKRLLIPLYGVGLFILLPPQAYIDWSVNRGYSGTIWELFPRYLGNLSLNFRTPYSTLPYAGHLWFLQHLFIISLVMLPLLLFLRSEAGRSFVNKLAGICLRPGGVFLFLLPLIAVRIAFKHFMFAGPNSWADLFTYAVFFVIGYIIAVDPSYTDSIKKHGWIGLALGIAGFSGFVFLLNAGYNRDAEPFSLKYVLFHIAEIVSIFGWIVFIFSMAAKHLNFRSRVISYGNEAVLPFYIFHLTVAHLAAWLVLSWNLGIVPKFLIITVVSFILIIALYEGFVRHFNVMRFIFGMRPKKKRIE
ncbi:MAG: acyltransferase [Spirochaetaceae bacterium]|nr:MAG: acyltransferase [Spirochaetaceae bacterium]